jgi:thiosulfate reductase cytochrome b subunit
MDTAEIRAPVAERPAVQPRWVRAVHWTNAIAFFTMLFSGWQIYEADPYWISVPLFWPTLGGTLPGALQWHFAAMWVLAINGAVAVCLLFASGRYRKLYLPLRPSRILRDMKGLLTGRIRHESVNDRNSVQKLAYTAVLLLLAVEILSGLSIWKPVQLQWLTVLFGGYETARRVHLVGMASLGSFVLGHILLALMAPRLLLAMLGIRRAPRAGESP